MKKEAEWLKDIRARYEFETKALVVYVPNSETDQEYVFTDKKTQDFVNRLLSAAQHFEALATVDMSQVTRFEVINHSAGGTGREFVKYGVNVELSFQDDNRTLKVFLDDKV